jgi:hypothetical protein
MVSGVSSGEPVHSAMPQLPMEASAILTGCDWESSTCPATGCIEPAKNVNPAGQIQPDILSVNTLFTLSKYLGTAPKCPTKRQ